MTYFPNDGLYISDPFFATFVVVVIFLLVWRWPEPILALLIVAANFVSNTHVNVLGLRSTLSLIYPLTIILLIRLVRSRRKDYTGGRQPLDPLVIGFAVFSGMIVLNYLIHAKVTYSDGVGLIRQHFVMSVIPFAGIAIVGQNQKRLHRTITAMLVILGLIQTIFLIGAINGLLQGDSVFQLRYLFIYGVPMFDARSELAVLFALTFLIVNTGRSPQVVYPLLLLVSVFLVIVGGSRAALLSVVVVIVYMSYDRGKLSRSVFFVALLLLLVALSSSVVLFTETSDGLLGQIVELFSTQYDRTFRFPIGEDPSSGRFEIWIQAWNSFVQSPLLGVGNGNATGVVAYFRPDGSVGLIRAGVHNYFLQILAENGIIGFVLFVVLLARMLWLMVQTRLKHIPTPELQRVRILGSAVLVLSLVQATTAYFGFGFWAGALLLIVYQSSQRTQNATQATRQPPLAVRPYPYARIARGVKNADSS